MNSVFVKFRDVLLAALSLWSGFKKITGLAIPIALSYTFSFSVVAIGLLAHGLYRSSEGAAAMTLVMTSVNSLTIIFISPLFALSIVASKLQGSIKKYSGIDAQRVKDRISAVNIRGMYICFALTPFLFLIFFFSKSIFCNMLGQSEVISQMAQSFLRVYAFAVPALLLRICYEQMLFSFAKAKPAMIIGMTSLIIGTFLAYVFSRGLFFIPAMGIPGIALGYVVEAYLMAISFAIYLHISKSFDGFCFFKFRGIREASDKLLKEIFSVSGPICFVVCNEVVLVFALSMAAGIAGVDSLAALNVSMEFIFFVFVFLSAFGQSCGQEVSRQLGAGDREGARYLSIAGAVASVVIIALFSSVAIFFPSLLTGLMEDHSKAVVSLAAMLLPIAATTTIFDSLRYHILQVLRAYRDLVKPMFISSVSIWLTIVLIFVVGIGFEYRAIGIVYSYLVGTIISSLVLLPRYIRKVNHLE